MPADAPFRNYKDAHHKPEIIFALSPEFRALSGFRTVAETRSVLAPVGDDARIAPLIERIGDDSALRDVFEWLISRGDGVDDLIAAVVEASAVCEGPSWHTVRSLAEHYPGDPGIVISLLLHTVVLKRGEVLYLPAGNIHAYLEGLGIELMAASDNVLRGGLTPKHIDVPELLSVLDFRPLPAPYLAPEEPEPGVRVFRPDVPDFRLTVVDADAVARGVVMELNRPAIALALGGDVAIGDEHLRPGHAAYLAELGSASLGGTGTLFIASVG